MVLIKHLYSASSREIYSNVLLTRTWLWAIKNSLNVSDEPNWEGHERESMLQGSSF